MARSAHLDDSLTLSAAERSDAAEELLRSLENEPDDADADVAWAGEIERRVEAGGEGVAAATVLAEGRARLSGSR